MKIKKDYRLLEAQRRLAEANSQYVRATVEHMTAIKQVSLIDNNKNEEALKLSLKTLNISGGKTIYW